MAWLWWLQRLPWLRLSRLPMWRGLWLWLRRLLLHVVGRVPLGMLSPIIRLSW